jgi:hypothetical protein
MAKVSVIIPCYNHGQTFHDFEIVIVDDGSKDIGTKELLRDYSRPKMRVLEKENGHLSSTRNRGIERSVGDYNWNFWIAVTKRRWFVHSIPEYLFLYRILEESMPTGAHAKRPQPIRKIVSNHPEVFGKHVEQVVYEKECEIEKLKDELDQMRRSLAFRLGWCLTQPGIVLRGLAKRICLWGAVEQTRHAMNFPARLSLKGLFIFGS